MKKVLFLIHDLGGGGAEKVLVNLVNNMDREKFDITVMSLFDVGVNRQFLAPHIRYIGCFKYMIPGNSHFMKLLSPKALHKWLIKEHYDIEVSYLEGPSARVISGCTDPETKLISWIHVEQHTMKVLAASFRSKREAKQCYNQFHKTICVSQYVKNDFCSILDYKKECEVLYNTVESNKILQEAQGEGAAIGDEPGIQIVTVGTLKQSKGYDRLLRIVRKLIKEGYLIHTYILGIGPMEESIRKFIKDAKLENAITLLGYQTNPYQYVAKCDLYVCASYSEGFSTATTEALIVGTPVCTVEVSGMKELLGANNEYGVVTDNTESALYEGIKKLLEEPELLKQYKEKAIERGKVFSTENTVKAVEKMLEEK